MTNIYIENHVICDKRKRVFVCVCVCLISVINRKVMLEEMMLKYPSKMKLLWMISLLRYGPLSA